MSRLRIPFDSLTLSAVVAEAQKYVGGRVQKVWQSDDNAIAFGIYKDGKEAIFLISAHPVFARAHFITKKPTNMQPLPGLATALRARIDGSRVANIQQLNFDRILVIDFETKEGPHSLIAELMGKHSNIMLLDPEGRVIAAAKWVGKSKSIRPIQAGKLYDPPPFEPKLPLTDAKPGDDLSSFQGVSPFVKKLMEHMGPNALADVQSAVRESSFDPVLVQGVGAYPISVAPLGIEGIHRSSISVALEQYFDWAIRDSQIHALKESLLGQLRRVLLARDVALSELKQAAELATRANEFQLMGELLLAYGPGLPAGTSEFDTEDYEGKALQIKLDPEKSYLENAETYFGKAKHAKAREGTVKDQIVRISGERDNLEGFIGKVEGEERLDRLQDLKDQAQKNRWLHQVFVHTKKKDERPYEGHRIREALGPGGFTILYGENSEANDYLLVRVARPNDYWLHVRGSASAHAVIVTQNHPEKVSKDTIMYAAKIVVQNSPSKHSGYVPVDYTLRKYVRKPKGAAKGMAMYTHEKTVHVEG